MYMDAFQFIVIIFMLGITIYIYTKERQRLRYTTITLEDIIESKLSKGINRLPCVSLIELKEIISRPNIDPRYLDFTVGFLFVNKEDNNTPITKEGYAGIGQWSYDIEGKMVIDAIYSLFEKYMEDNSMLGYRVHYFANVTREDGGTQQLIRTNVSDRLTTINPNNSDYIVVPCVMHNVPEAWRDSVELRVYSQKVKRDVYIYKISIHIPKQAMVYWMSKYIRC